MLPQKEFNMKIAVISDIHGNMEAVDAVMEDIKKTECDKLFVLGDYAMAGPEPQKTIQYFIEKENENTIMIQGNTDLMIADYNPDLFKKLSQQAPVMASALKDDVKQMSLSDKLFLKNLPAQKEIELEGVSFLLVHGSPRKNNEDILPDTSIEEVESMLKDVKAQVVLCGHTHIPCGFQTKNKQTVVNAGSVGRPFTPEPKACYLMISVAQGKCVFEHKFVKYDNKKASEKLKEREFFGADKLAETLINPKKRHF